MQQQGQIKWGIFHDLELRHERKTSFLSQNAFWKHITFPKIPHQLPAADRIGTISPPDTHFPSTSFYALHSKETNLFNIP